MYPSMMFLIYRGTERYFCTKHTTRIWSIGLFLVKCFSIQHFSSTFNYPSNVCRSIILPVHTITMYVRDNTYFSKTEIFWCNWHRTVYEINISRGTRNIRVYLYCFSFELSMFSEENFIYFDLSNFSACRRSTVIMHVSHKDLTILHAHGCLI